MGSAGTPKSGRTLGLRWSGEGSADLRSRLNGYTLRRAVLAGIAIGAFVVGIAAASAVLEGEVDPGFVVDATGSRVEAVTPAGYAWQGGVRTGQAVVAIGAADEPGGWRLETTDGTGHFVVVEATANDGLAATWALAAGSLGIGGVALLLLRARRQWVLPAAAIAFVVAGPPLVQSGNVALATLDLAFAALVPTGWAIERLPGGTAKSAVMGAGLAGFVAIWAVARSTGTGGVDSLEWARQSLGTWGSGVLVLDRVLALRAGGPMLLTRPRPFDVAAVALVAGGALALVTLFPLPPLVIAGLAAAAVIAIPTMRRRLRPIENALLADVRAQAAVEATEQERGRLARELHDVPLQELFGVIRRLEVKPGAEAESDDLRALASHLRNVAIDLRPPVLDDLGLPAALEYLAEGATGPVCPVVAEISDGTGIARAQRPPEAVELAMFRIAMEAVANAVAHAGATQIRVAAAVEPKRVELRIIDNGTGLDPTAAKDSVRRRHMGLNSMHRRADAIDADFAIKATKSGTTVEAVWQS